MIFLLALLFQAPAELPAPREALVFPGGQAFLSRRFALEPDARRASFLLPAAERGSFWLSSESHAVQRAQARWEEIPLERPVRSLADAVRMAVGGQVVLEVAGKPDSRFVPGTLLRLLESPEKIPIGRPLEAGVPESVVLATELGIQVLPFTEVRGVRFSPDFQPGWTYTAPLRRELLEVELEPHSGAGSTPSLWISSLAQGLSWSPSFYLQLGGKDRARLVGKALVINDLEDLTETRVRLVLGRPNFAFHGLPSFLLPEASFPVPRPSVPENREESMAGIPMLRELGYSAPAAPAGPVVPLPEVSSEDLHIYEAGSLTLKKGERAYLPLLEQEIAIEHRFDWEIPDRVDRRARFRPLAGEESPPVRHVLKLHNEGQVPWPPAPVLVAGPDGPLAQAVLGFAPAGGDAEITLAQATELEGEILEVRAESEGQPRKPGSLFGLFGNKYESIEIQGDLVLHNRGSKTVRMHVVKHLSGDVLSTQGEPEVESRALGLGQVNAARTLTWESSLQPGAVWKTTFHYRVLVRR